MHIFDNKNFSIVNTVTITVIIFSYTLYFSLVNEIYIIREFMFGHIFFVSHFR